MSEQQFKDDVLSKDQINGIQKAALLMIALDIETAASVLKYLDPEQVEKISAEITKVKNIPSKVVDSIMQDFYDMVTAREYVLEGGLEYAQAILEKSFGMNKAIEIVDKVKSLTTLKGFDVLKKADSVQLVSFLSKEHPQTIALILSHLNPDQTAEALKELSPELRADVAFRIATLGKVSPQTLKQIEKVVDEMAGTTLSQSVSKIGGSKSLANILNRLNINLTKEILEQIEINDPDVAAEVKRLMFMFEDIINIQDKDIQKILKEVDRKDLALALKVADDALRNKIFSNMSERAADLLKEELQYMGMVKLKEVEAAQSKIIDIIKSLEESGEISLNMRGSKEDVYV
ncbi:Flagellar motor switch protein FliG [Ignavibacterium album JCM 16511]|uniref:Flagellar motor switch protein FliG n=1 Tax=Ignavibacterium album (strain DSM 19864 / JCM 16511 / NBRC 101810 / Mat9-16) TaxID=945713 RepID=I0AMN8_IGNAJ|nr:flagellar motor switch protein FliG [Ignavibacterium album]AFH50245.1 Flagellar motor switch protein FliG [Ignavibacterium album JCM 16511]